MSDEKFTAQELSDFYQRVADGEDILNETVIHKSGPNLSCYSSNWSTGPKLIEGWVNVYGADITLAIYDSSDAAKRMFEGAGRQVFMREVVDTD